MTPKKALIEQWLPPVVAGLMTGGIALASNLWLVPAQKKASAIFEEKRVVAKEVQAGFTKFLVSFNVYRHHMVNMDSVDQTNDAEVKIFKDKFQTLYDEHKRQTVDLSYVLATTSIYFSTSVSGEIEKFRSWHNVADKRITNLAPEQWPSLRDYQGWRQKIVVALRTEIIGG